MLIFHQNFQPERWD